MPATYPICTYISTRVDIYADLVYDRVVRYRVNFYIDPELADGLKVLKERDGIPESEQIRRGIKLWLESKGIKTPKRAGKGGRMKK